MPTDKIIEIDLTELTSESLGKLVKIQKDIVDKLEKTGKRTKKGTKQQLVNEFQRTDEQTEKLLEKLKKEVEFDLISGKGKETLKSKLFGKQDFSKGGIAKNIVKFGLNPGGMVGGLLKTGIPGFGAAVFATAIIGRILKKFDDLEKKFTDQINTKINADRDNVELARIQAGIAQDIFSPSPGIYDPRDSYNSLNEKNINQQRVETDYTLRSTQATQ